MICALDFAVELDPDRPDVLDAEPFSVQPDAVPVGGELDRVESVPPLESGIARLLPGLDPAKERLERLVEPPHVACADEKLMRA